MDNGQSFEAQRRPSVDKLPAAFALTLGESRRSTTVLNVTCFNKRFQLTISPRFAESFMYLVCETPDCGKYLYWSLCSKCKRETQSTQYAWRRDKDSLSWAGWGDWLVPYISDATDLNYLEACLLAYEVEATLLSICADLTPGYASQGAVWHAAGRWAAYGASLAVAR